MAWTFLEFTAFTPGRCGRVKTWEDEQMLCLNAPMLPQPMPRTNRNKLPWWGVVGWQEFTSFITYQGQRARQGKFSSSHSFEGAHMGSMILVEAYAQGEQHIRTWKEIESILRIGHKGQNEVVDTHCYKCKLLDTECGLLCLTMTIWIWIIWHWFLLSVFSL